tara:strand:+ start:15496 stop:15942 length:447 start_codon:yes stop_codon:yes gene_type:complete
MQKVYKKFSDEKLDFNQLTNLISEAHFESKQSSKWLENFILQGTIVVKNVHQHPAFKSIINKIVKEFQLQSRPMDVDLYVGFTQGASSNIHKDDYNVYLYNLYGRVIYNINKENYMLEEKDLISIKKGDIHQAIGLSPRITLSLGVYD